MTILFVQVSPGKIPIPIPLQIAALSVVTDEMHDLQAQVSRFAREDRVIAADHIILEPATLEISVSVSNVPIIPGLGAIPFLPGAGRSENGRTVLGILEGLRRRRELLEILTEHRLYRNMAFLGITFQNTGTFSGSTSFRLRFEEFPEATVETVPEPEELSKEGGGQTDKTASAAIDAGRQNAITPETVDNRSFAAQLLDRS